MVEDILQSLHYVLNTWVQYFLESAEVSESKVSVASAEGFEKIVYHFRFKVREVV